MKKNLRKGAVLMAGMLLMSMTLTGCKKEKVEVTDAPVTEVAATEESKEADKNNSKEVASDKTSTIAKEDVSAQASKETKEVTKESAEQTDKTAAKEEDKTSGTKTEATKTEASKTETSKEETKTEPSKAETSKEETKAEPSKAETSKEETKTEPSKEETTQPAKPADKETSSSSGTESSASPSTPSAPAHSHTWDGGTVTKAATCSESGEITYRCSCGESTTESIPASEHNYTTVVDKEPDCTSPGWSYQLCTICGRTGDGWASDALGHDVESYEKCGGNCVTGAQMGNRCRRCGAELGDSFGDIDPNNHNWVTIESEVFNEATMKWETVTGTYCGNGCGATQ